jgi:hypothetical protein
MARVLMAARDLSRGSSAHAGSPSTVMTVPGFIGEQSLRRIVAQGMARVRRALRRDGERAQAVEGDRARALREVCREDALDAAPPPVDGNGG